MYGGRVIDDFDRRITRIYMDEYMGDFLFDTFNPFHFYHDENVDYSIPDDEVVLKEDFIGESKNVVSKGDEIADSNHFVACMHTPIHKYSHIFLFIYSQLILISCRSSTSRMCSVCIQMRKLVIIRRRHAASGVI